MFPCVRQLVLRSMQRKSTATFKFHSSATRLHQCTGPLTQFTDDELMTKEAVAKLAREEIAPLVRKMEKDGKIDDGLLAKFFENGLMGIEIPTEYGGTGSNFMSTILTIEEISKVDAAMAISIDIQNTLINSLILKIGSEEQKRKTCTCAMDNVQDKTVLITGGVGGLGSEFVKIVLENGAKKVAIVDLPTSQNRAKVAEFERKYGKSRVAFFPCDITKVKEYEETFKKIVDAFG
ncbi:Short/branched chain specific acyl-CoA dehydrogenase, mitochondrial [Harpegnathos saltator]|uniref:Short/branched chain specific acyl-CoA dehydrogenase, mitochondrial n=1 Tax=Harpegnathos saltator TaxID=610380 RepID=E2C5E6_HARSA|nr:Short/branched chain specific acyl-CoA dehydrogenase, mitochondrial [Harpegnathos saltator]